MHQAHQIEERLVVEVGAVAVDDEHVAPIGRSRISPDEIERCRGQFCLEIGVIRQRQIALVPIFRHSNALGLLGRNGLPDGGHGLCSIACGVVHLPEIDEHLAVGRVLRRHLLIYGNRRRGIFAIEREAGEVLTEVRLLFRRDLRASACQCALQRLFEERIVLGGNGDV